MDLSQKSYVTYTSTFEMYLNTASTTDRCQLFDEDETVLVCSKGYMRYGTYTGRVVYGERSERVLDTTIFSFEYNKD